MQNNLGTIYYNGLLGVNEDMAQALKFYLLDAKSDMKDRCSGLQIFIGGMGTK